ncbi:MAG: hypothetical protein GXX12_03525 [Methanosarcina thermophila]|uniref:hypothetical protein n=1 Tax=Methanosarcina thermophila TaxID=2210 RepID=UPI000A94C887|nr:hypothetical protein [Methanosarcina thermophila]NLU56515.1 hypothetical protein [Methanosarcina thermophila]
MDGQPCDIISYDIGMYDFSMKKENKIITSGTAFYPVIYGEGLYEKSGLKIT